MIIDETVPMAPVLIPSGMMMSAEALRRFDELVVHGPCRGHVLVDHRFHRPTAFNDDAPPPGDHPHVWIGVDGDTGVEPSAHLRDR